MDYNIQRCAAWGCSNRTEHGKRMFIFPADKARRKTWEAKVNRSNWVPSRSSYLCEAHFDENQFEPRCTDRRKLKKNAIPTLFVHSKPVKRRKKVKQNVIQKEPEDSHLRFVKEHSYATLHQQRHVILKEHSYAIHRLIYTVVSKDAEPSKMIKLEKDIQSSSCPTTKLIDQMMDRTVHHQPA